MMRAYSELYLNDAKENLADAFDYAVNVCGLDGEWFVRLFVQSGFAEKFERGNPSVISGLSGVELAGKIIAYAYPKKKTPETHFTQGRSPEYWMGWALAEYQWMTGRNFKDIFSRVPYQEIVSMYQVYHEMDVLHFIEEMDRRYESVQRETKLKIIRENRGISQTELAKLSGVKLRSIQMYEQKVNDIDKAQAGTVYKLSRVLGCSVEDILENPSR